MRDSTTQARFKGARLCFTHVLGNRFHGREIYYGATWRPRIGWGQHAQTLGLITIRRPQSNISPPKEATRLPKLLASSSQSGKVMTDCAPIMQALSDGPHQSRKNLA